MGLEAGPTALVCNYLLVALCVIAPPIPGYQISQVLISHLLLLRLTLQAARLLGRRVFVICPQYRK